VCTVGSIERKVSGKSIIRSPRSCEVSKEMPLSATIPKGVPHRRWKYALVLAKTAAHPIDPFQIRGYRREFCAGHTLGVESGSSHNAWFALGAKGWHIQGDCQTVGQCRLGLEAELLGGTTRISDRDSHLTRPHRTVICPECGSR
jgi:hypothetical protein